MNSNLFQSLHNDTLFEIFKYIDNIYLLQFVCKRFNLIFESENLWEYHFYKFFPSKVYEIMHFNSYKNTFIKCTMINKIINTFHLETTLIEIYQNTFFSLAANQITIIPKEIGQLINLQVLHLYHNQITTIPKEIGQLINLQYLY